MAFEFTQEQIDELIGLKAAGRFAEAYTQIYTWSSVSSGGSLRPHPEIDAASWTWFWGAKDINAGIGPFSDFIRTYTATQSQIRFERNLSASEMQSISNLIADAVLADVIASRTVPSLASIGTQDASKTSTTFFEGDEAVWSGNVLFLPLGNSSFYFNTILEKAGDTYDLLAMMKSLAAATGTLSFNSIGTVMTGLWTSAMNNGIGPFPTASLAAGAITASNNFLHAAYGGFATLLQTLNTDSLILGTVRSDSAIEGRSGGEFMNGGKGDDTLKWSTGNDIMDGGEGRDIADFSGASAKLNVTIKMETSTATYIAGVSGAGGLDTLFGIEEIRGSGQDDMFLIRSWPDMQGQLTLDGGGGDDQLTAFYLTGGVQIDAVAGRVSNGGKSAEIKNFEKYEGTNENDRFTLKGDEKQVLGRGGDRDVADFSQAQQGVTVGAGGLELKDIEHIIGTDQVDTIRTDAGDQIIEGRGAGDTLEGGAGNDTYHVDGGDTVRDSDGQGKLLAGGRELQGGQEEGEDDGSACGAPENKSDDEKTYKDDAGNIYKKSGGGLTIELSGGGTVTVQGWSDGQLGITLKPRDPSGGGGKPCEPPQENASPLILDLDGDGIEVTQLRENSVFFDVDNDGIRERSSWASADDGLLALDRNGNGVIDGVSELFGYGRTISVTPDDISGAHPDPGVDDTWTSGFDQLALLDNVSDGVLDAADSAYALLRVWRDIDQDGVSDADELFSLADLGIARIDLASTTANEWLGDNFVSDRGSFQLTDGTTRGIADVWFAFDQQDTQYDMPALDAETAALPTLRGTGAVKDLRSAAAEDAGLKALVQSFAGLGMGDLPALFARVEEILLRWHGVEDVSANSRGAFADARHLGVYESLWDTGFRQWSGPNPRPFAGAQIEEDYQLYVRNSGARLLLQTELGQELFPELTVQGASLFLAAGTDSGDVLDRLAAAAPSDMLSAIGYWNAVLRVLDGVHESFADVKAAANGVEAYRQSVTALLAARGIDLDYAQIVDARIGGAGDDTFVTTSVDFGLSYGGPEVVAGGAGNDEIRLGGNKQIVYFGAGQGDDVVVGTPFSYHDWEFEPRVEIRLVGLNAGDITITRGGDALSPDIVITITATGETLTLRNAITEATLQSAIVFADGTTASVFEATPDAADLLLGATDGDDRLEDILGEDFLDGGAGNDVLIGLDGDDVYGFDRGGGADLIIEAAGGGFDTLLLADGITVDDVGFTRRGVRGEDLVITILDTGEEIVVADQFASANSRLEQLVLADGATADAETLAFLASMTPDETGRLLGYDWSDDFFDVYAPGTLFTGFGGSDQYAVYDSAPGIFTIADRGSDTAPNGGTADVDRVSFGADLAEVTITRIGSDVFVFSLADGHEVRIDNAAGRIEEFSFFDTDFAYAEMVAEIIRREQASGATEIVGTSGPETLTGTENGDTIRGIDGNDIIFGLGGDDLIDAGWGNNVVDGGAGNDRIETSYGIDDIRGGTGDDVIVDIDDTTIIRFDVGDGSDLVLTADTFTPASRVVFGTGITAADLRYSFAAVNASSYSDYFEFGTEQYALRISFATGTDSLTLVGSEFADDISGMTRLQLADGSNLFLSTILADLRIATDADQFIVGSNGFDILSGGRGNDTLVGGDSTSSFSGSTDEFGYDLGDGHDTVLGNATTGSVVRFGAGIAPGDITISRAGENGADLVFTVTATGETLTVRNQFTDDIVVERDANDERIAHYETTSYVGSVRFADGTIWSSADVLAALATVTAGNDTVTFTAAAETIDGGAGDDTLAGGLGSDVYLFGHGSGADNIVETARSMPFPFVGDFPGPVNGMRDIDELRFGAGITLTDLDIIVSGTDQGDMTIRIRGTDDQVVIARQLADGGNWGDAGAEEWASQYADEFGPEPLYAAGIERFSFADGTSYDRHQFLELVTARDNAGDNVIGSSDAGGTLDGGAGIDQLNGGRGDDTYVFAAGYAEDTATDTGGDDTVAFGAGVNPNYVAFSRTGTDGQDLLIEVDGPERLALTIKDQFAPGDRRIESFDFADGSHWTWQQIQAQILSASISEQADVIRGFAGADVILARGGDDTIRTGGGADVIDGGSGWDVVEFDGPQSRYDVVAQGSRLIVIDREAGAQRVTLTNVEEIRFLGDGTGGGAGSVTPNGNAAPDATDTSFTVNEDTVLRLTAADLLAAASDPDGGSLTLAEVGNALGGSVALDVNGNVVFTPLANFTGTASFTYRVRDGGGLSDSATVTVTVAPVNDAPVAVAVLEDVTVAEDSFVSFALPANAFADVDSTPILAARLADGASLPSWLGFDAGTGSFSGQPPAHFHGALAIVVTASDGIAEASSSFVLTIDPVNDAPVVATPIADQEISAGAAWSFAVGAAFTDADGDMLAWSATLEDGSPLPAWLAFDPETGTFSGTAPADAAGSYTVAVLAHDGLADVEDRFVLTVTAGNAAPVVASPLADADVAEDTAVLLTVPADAFADADGDTLVLSAALADGAALPSWLVFDPEGRSFSGQPPADFTGALEIRVTASDGALTASDVFVLTITPVNDAPVLAVPLADVSVAEGAPVAITVPAGTFADVDGDALTLSAALADGAPLPSWLDFDGTTLAGQPPADFDGTLSIRITATDGTLSASDVFVLSFAPENDAPVLATPLADVSSAEDTPVSITVPANAFTDVDGDPLTLAAALADGAALPAWLSFDAATRSFTGQPPANFTGDLAIRVTASDGTLSASDVFVLSITPVNDAPVVAAPLADASVAEDSPVSITLPAGAFADGDGDALALSATLASGAALPAWLSFDAATRSFAGQPPANFNGSLSIRVTASDGALSVSDTFVLAITPVNDAPVAVADTGTAGENESRLFDVVANDNDVDAGDTRTLTQAVVRSVSGVSGLTAAAAQAAFAIESGQLRFSPGTLFDPLNAGQNATVVIDYQIVDAAGAPATGTFTLTVTGADEAPSDIQYGTNGNDTLFGSNNADVIHALGGNDSVFANGGNDTVLGGDGADNLFGGAGDDILSGGNGNDRLYAQGGNDSLDGGAGDDQLFGTADGETLTGGSGNDLIYGNGGTDIIDGGDGNDGLYGGSGADTIRGGAGNDQIYGNGGTDLLEGGSGNDQIYGGNQADQIADGDGADTVYANGGADRITMGGGNDLVWGGGGNDTFVFAGSFGRDTIGDFRAGGGSEDVLEFDTELFVSFADVMAHAANLGGHTVITVDAATSITLQYVTVNNLHQDDFRFV